MPFYIGQIENQDQQGLPAVIDVYRAGTIVPATLLNAPGNRIVADASGNFTIEAAGGSYTLKIQLYSQVQEETITIPGLATSEGIFQAVQGITYDTGDMDSLAMVLVDGEGDVGYHYDSGTFTPS